MKARSTIKGLTIIAAHGIMMLNKIGIPSFYQQFQFQINFSIALILLFITDISSLLVIPI